MKLYTANDHIKLYEQLIETENQEVTHLKIEKGKTLETHSHPWHVIVVIYKGKIDFTGDNGCETIVPGNIIQMSPSEPHKLVALEDSDLIVIKSKLAKSFKVNSK